MGTTKLQGSRAVSVQGGQAIATTGVNWFHRFFQGGLAASLLTFLSAGAVDHGLRQRYYWAIGLCVDGCLTVQNDQP